MKTLFNTKNLPANIKWLFVYFELNYILLHKKLGCSKAPKNASLKVHNLQDTQNLMSLKCQKTRKKHRDASHIPVFSKLKWQIHTF